MNPFALVALVLAIIGTVMAGIARNTPVALIGLGLSVYLAGLLLR
jgi:hypothetical protein